MTASYEDAGEEVPRADRHATQTERAFPERQNRDSSCSGRQIVTLQHVENTADTHGVHPFPESVSMDPLTALPQSRNRILIVDDEAAIRLMFQQELELAGFDAVVAVGGADGL